MWLSKYEYAQLNDRIKTLEKALTCYGDLRHEKEYILSAEKLGDKLREIDERSIYYSGVEHRREPLNAKEIMKRFTELYSLLDVDRVNEPYPTLRKRV